MKSDVLKETVYDSLRHMLYVEDDVNVGLDVLIFDIM
jgi:hypothetical protein